MTEQAAENAAAWRSLTMMTKTKAEQLADAYAAVARVNHYMVGITAFCTIKERDDAEQILIARQNALPSQSGRKYKTLDLALDVLAYDRRGQQISEMPMKVKS